MEYPWVFCRVGFFCAMTFDFEGEHIVSIGTRIRRNLVLVMAGGMLVISAVAWSQRQEAVAIPPLPNHEDLSAALRTVAAAASPSIVSIETTTKGHQTRSRNPQMQEEEVPAPFREFFRRDPQQENQFPGRGRSQGVPQQHGMGSGFIIDASGIILTNSHVVTGADQIKVRLSDGREFIGKGVKTDSRTDVAIVRIDATDLKPLRLGDSQAIQVGDWVLAIGSPFGLEASVTAGIISAKGRSGRITQRADFLQTDAAINPGNSGGPLLNLRGEVIGINTAIATQSGGYDGIGFAIPTHIAGWVSQELITVGHVTRGYIGTEVAAVNVETAKQFHVKLHEGALVRSVLPGSPADKAGLEPGDLIMKLSGHVIKNPTDLQGAAERLAIGKTYPMEISHNGKHQTVQVTIAEMPKSLNVASQDDQDDVPGESKSDKFGLEVRPLTKDLAKQLGLSGDSGLVITGIEEGSAAQTAGLKVGDVIEKAAGQRVATTEDYEKLRDKSAKADGLVLNIRSSDGKRSFVVLKAE